MSENMSPPVSILVGTRNRVEPLARCIESVLSQTYRHSEILVLDDASDIDIRDALKQRFPDQRLKWLRSLTPSGVAGARNTLIQSATGECRIFLAHPSTERYL